LGDDEMNTQTEALLLAETLEADATSGDMGRKPDPKCHKRKAAAELRRLQGENERLNKALTWEQNRAERIGTHGPGCHTWGPAHYECLLRVNAELVEALKVFCSLGRADSSTDWNVAFNEGAKAIAKATGETK
jgi:hypothetical protein